jgi:hypothetical protein
MPVQIQSSHSREFKGALRYNSPDYLVCHRTVRCTSGATANLHQRSSLTDEQCSTVPRQKSEQRVRGAADCSVWHRTVQCHKRTKPPTVDQLRTLTVGWRGGAPDCPVRPSPAASTTATLVVEGYKYPQPPQLQVSKTSEDHIQCKSSSIHS